LKGFIAKLAALFAGCFAALAVVNAASPPPPVRVVAEKLDALAARSDDDAFNVLFVGSSYVYREISPAVFDAEMQARGLATRSFNFGVGAMRAPETYVVLERILATGPKRLEWVVLEVDEYQFRVAAENVETQRFTWWHDTPATARVVRAVAGSNLPLPVKAKAMADHLEGYLRNRLRFGRGRELFAVDMAREGGSSMPLGPARDGFMALDDETKSGTRERRQAFEEGGDVDFATRLRDLEAETERARSGGASLPSDVEMRELRRALDMIRAAGARPILLFPPTFTARASSIRLAHELVGDDVLVFNDPTRYPELYVEENRFDVLHFNKRGALDYTKLLAARMAELLSAY
jgi:hypothetical protein